MKRLFPCFCDSACLCKGDGRAIFTVSEPPPPSFCSTAAPSTLVNPPISHWDSPAKGGLLEERCWANGMTALVMWKLPALYASRYWQWCSRRMYDSSQTLVNFSPLFRCQLYTNEVIEHALYAVASTLLTQRSRTGASLWWHCYRTNHTRMTNTRNFECFFFSRRHFFLWASSLTFFKSLPAHTDFFFKLEFENQLFWEWLSAAKAFCLLKVEHTILQAR